MSRPDNPDLKQRVIELEKSYSFFNSHIRQLESLLSQCLKTGKENAKALVKIESAHLRLEKYTHSLEEYCLELDAGTRKKHLIHTGVAESDKEINGSSNDTQECPTHEVAYSTLSTILDTLESANLMLGNGLGHY